MNHRQKLGYMALGAGILAVGITIGQFIIPNIEAQNNGVFDEITCRELSVVDEKGEKGIWLFAADYSSFISLGNSDKGHINLVALKDKNAITLSDDEGNKAIQLNSGEDRNSVEIFDKVENSAISLTSVEGLNGVGVKDPNGNIAIELFAFDDHKRVEIFDKGAIPGDGVISLIVREGANQIGMKSKVGKEAIRLLASEKTGASIFITDRAGKLAWGTP